MIDDEWRASQEYCDLQRKGDLYRSLIRRQDKAPKLSDEWQDLQVQIKRLSREIDNLKIICNTRNLWPPKGGFEIE